MAGATGPTYKVAFRRRRENKTNYAKRLGMLKSGLPRMVVRKSGRGILVQFIEFSAAGDKVLACCNSDELRAFGWAPRSNAPTAYLSAMHAAKKAKAKGASTFILDIGMQTPSKGAIAFAAAQGAQDAGLKTNYDGSMIAAEQINGAHIQKYAQSLAGSDAYKKAFSSYIAENFDPTKIADIFNAVKQKVQAQKVN
jgi:large subunit ribosomal protein L18